jgi:hypothetical protein
MHFFLFLFLPFPGIFQRFSKLLPDSFLIVKFYICQLVSLIYWNALIPRHTTSKNNIKSSSNIAHLFFYQYLDHLIYGYDSAKIVIYKYI